MSNKNSTRGLAVRSRKAVRMEEERKNPRDRPSESIDRFCRIPSKIVALFFPSLPRLLLPLANGVAPTFYRYKASNTPRRKKIDR